MFQPARDLDPTVAAVSYQLGRAQQELGHFEDAAAAFQETLKLEPNHPVAHYALSQALIRAGRPDEAQAGHREAQGNPRQEQRRPRPAPRSTNAASTPKPAPPRSS